ncbi:Ribose transport system permease protein RbsC [Pseudovibrio sp. W64]|uniref:ABC transporter permease n=1 Tax=Pseudovibrio TaxID=258255 RepID=UPI0007AE55A0|nr:MULTISPECIES: ABC transporter permease [unclassified Pseudovibrio]KZK75839.1 Ribose transport system permease protein RbsC [Pseudovibrio sp. Ad13]KZK87679.1 Ribose transport system permease protein RbsC [Pseudovibrio sp. W64]KZL03732.1 Ribose transport system permease protein RbsC [Pseudovibrio sp. W74]KZL09554.1 Ribose transport system permease protein RbsC [Pseudovibrio sp. Ad14]KZL13067.1 Ribose transport system permease protein RbsC [Pseudovibrio sp. Ad26]
MANATDVAETNAPARKLPVEANIFLVLIGIAVFFEILGWIVKGDTFLFNPQRLLIMVLQVSIIGLLAIGVTQVIITGGIDLSSGSVLALSAMVAASFAQTSDYTRAVFPMFTDMPFLVPVLAGIAVGALAGFINGSLIAYTAIPPFIATLGMMVTARGLARYYTKGQPISLLSEEYMWLGSGTIPVIIFLMAAFIFHIALRFTRYGKFTYATGANVQAAKVSGINVGRHLIKVYTLAGLLAGLGGVVAAARAGSGQAGMGLAYELDAIAAAVIGGTSLAGGVGRITGTVIGTIILGTMMSGFTFLGIDAYIQDIVKGGIIVAAVVADQYRQRKRAKV